MKLIIFSALLCLFIQNAYSLELQKERHEICGVEKRETKRHSLCGTTYHSEAEYPCPAAAYNKRTNAAICGYRRGSCIKYDKCAVGTPNNCAEPANDAVCVAWRRVPDSCRHISFGVERYKTCEHPDFGFKEYKLCTKDHPDFAPILFYECEFYKTPEELDEYLTGVKSVMEVYALDLADAKSDLYSRVGNEKAFWCMIDKYEGDIFYDEIILDLKDTFFLEFDIDYTEVSYDCSKPIADIKVLIASIDCDDLSIPELKTMSQPSGTTRGQFVRFRNQCRAKKSHEAKEDWFVTKEYELGLLVNDIVAKSNADIKADIEEVSDFISAR